MDVDADVDLSSQLDARQYVGSSDIARYELKEKLGEGTFGVVWRGIRAGVVGPVGGGGGRVRGDEATKERERLEEDRLVREQGLKVRQGDVVALKQIIFHNETDGVSVPAGSLSLSLCDCGVADE